MDRKRKQTHDVLLDAMFGLAIDGELGSASIQTIADRADVAVGTFYNHFENREAAIAELSSTQSDSFGALISEIDSKSSGPVETLTPIADGLIELLDSASDPAKFLMAVNDIPAWPIGPLSRQLADIIGRGQALGELDGSGAPLHRALLISSLIRTLISIHVDNDGAVDKDMFVHAVLATAGAR
jgi:AcrR family transcriptional regulator